MGQEGCRGVEEKMQETNFHFPRRQSYLQETWLSQITQRHQVIKKVTNPTRNESMFLFS